MKQKPLDRNYFNIDLLIPDDDTFKNLGLSQVTSSAIFETNSDTFNKDGLFSNTIFGPIGSDLRMTRPGYLDLKFPIMHPLIFTTISRLGKKYKEILAGKLYVSFNEATKDFEVDNINGQTGYAYFCKYMDKIVYKTTDSSKREYKISLVEKYGRSSGLITKWLILPAGLRDYTVDEKGTPSEDEINDIYRKLLGLSIRLSNISITEENISLYDPIRYQIQLLVNEIYSYIKNLIDGKSKFIQSKWSSRAVSNATSNVITGMSNTIKDLTKDNYIGFNNTVVGLFQYLKSLGNIAMNKVNQYFLNHVFDLTSQEVRLINPETLKSEYRKLDHKTITNWTSVEGINNIINKQIQDEIKVEPVKIDGYYIALKHYDKSTNTITVYLDTDEIPDNIDRSELKPITYVEMFYISVYDCCKEFPLLNTRYPITGIGSIYPSYAYLKTTLKSLDCKVKIGIYELDVPEYPILEGDVVFFRSMSVNVYHYEKLGADTDGDSIVGSIYFRCRCKNFQSDIINMKEKKSSFNINNKGKKMSFLNEKAKYTYGVVNMEEFPKGKLLKKYKNKEIYAVPNGIEVLTVWNGELQWCKPESFSVHRDLNMLDIKSNRSRTLTVSDDHSMVEIDDNLNYKRSKAKLGMCIPRIRKSISDLAKEEKLLRKVNDDETGIVLNLDHDTGYLLGAMIGDGWISIDRRKEEGYSLHLANISQDVINKLTEVLRDYGYTGKPYTIDSPHEFDGYKCFSRKTSWFMSKFARTIKKCIGHMAANKHLPQFWGHTTDSFRWGLLAGLIDTDGCTHIDKRGRPNVSFTTISSTLAYEFIALANSLNLIANYSLNTNRGKSEYCITFTNESISKMKKKLKLLVKEKKDILEKMTFIKDIKEKLYAPCLKEKRYREILKYIIEHKKEVLQSIKEYNIKYDLKDKKALTYDRFIGNIYEMFKKMKISYIRSLTQLTAELFFEIIPDFFKDGFWKKYKDMTLDENIEFEYVTEIKKNQFVTIGYDITVPPQYTMVTESGWVVYDTLSLFTLYTDESKQEIKDLLNSPEYYISTTSEFNYSVGTNTLNIVLKTLTE